MRRDVELGIIAETLAKTIPGAAPANLSVLITEHRPNRGENTWTGGIDALAERVFTALYGRPTAPGVTPLAAITEVLRRPFPTVATADLISGADIRQYDPAVADAPEPWAMEVTVLALKIHDRLFGAQVPADAPPPDARDLSPLAQAEDAKRRRDLPGELGALMDGERALRSAPWYPSQVGDLVHVHYEGHGPLPAWGETYAVEPDPGFADSLRLRLLHHTAKGDAATEAGVWATTGADPAPLFGMWFEAGPAVLTIVRDGRVVHLGPAVPGT
ncbi:hypothetical protein ACWFRQ_17815 [Streptomyces niveus]